MRRDVSPETHRKVLDVHNVLSNGRLLSALFTAFSSSLPPRRTLIQLSRLTHKYSMESFQSFLHIFEFYFFFFFLTPQSF